MSRSILSQVSFEAESEPETGEPVQDLSSPRPAVSQEVLDALRSIGVPMDAGDEGNGGTDDPIAWQLLGHCLEEMGESGGAQRCYARAARRLVRERREGLTSGVSMSSNHPSVEPLPFAVFQRSGNDLSH